MKYSKDREGKGIFLFSGEEEAKISADTMQGNPWAYIIDEFLKAKAITDYIAENKLALSDDQETRAKYVDVLQRLELLCARRIPQNQENPLWVDQVPFRELQQVYETMDRDLVSRLYGRVRAECERLQRW